MIDRDVYLEYIRDLQESDDIAALEASIESAKRDIATQEAALQEQ
jgi:hypothetical protein